MPVYIYILLSIKTRIETNWDSDTRWWYYQIYILLSIKTRIETNRLSIKQLVSNFIYILLSIKTRIETLGCIRSTYRGIEFISYYPLKQGLKLTQWSIGQSSKKPFISYYPLKQGLKPLPTEGMLFSRKIYILLSIKTRIETSIGY